MWPSVVAFFTLVLRTNTGRIGLVVVAIHLGLAVFGPWITPYPPTEYHIQDQYSAPNSTYWLGTDEKGRDVFSRVLAGARSIIWIATAGTILGVTFGTIVGVTSGLPGAARSTRSS